MIGAIDDDTSSAPVYDARLARRLLRYVRPSAGLAAAAVALTVATGLLGAAPPWILGRAVDAGIVARDPVELRRLAAIYLAIEAVRLALGFGHSLAVALVGQRVTLDLRLELAGKIVRQSLSFFSREPAGRLVSRVMNDVSNLGELFSTGIVAVMADLFAIAISGAILVYIDARLAAITLLVVPLLILAVEGVNRRIRAAQTALRRLLARVAATLAESMNGIRAIQLFGREAEAGARFERLNAEHLGVQLRAMRLHALYVSLITTITSGTIAAIVWQGGDAALRGAIDLGTFVAFVGYASALFLPVRDLAEKYATFQSAMASAERVFKLLDDPVEVAAPAQARPLPHPLRGEIEFRDVSFGYRGAGAPALRRVSFKIAPGARVAIVGRTGAGKSTVVNLLGRFYDPGEGAVLVDGVDVRAVDERALRREIGIVLQDVFVFAGTIRDNIRLGDPRISEAAAREAARAVGAAAWIERLPRGYAEEMRERGSTLSAGQKQLLSFARALAFDPRVLVLDEATASVDPETEAALRDAMRTIMRGRTSIVIAHRLATVRDVDRVLVFHEGELREDGTPEELRARPDGIFARLWRLQSSGEGDRIS